MFDRQIHRDDFRLRLLLTNKCNKECYHCLNDFQTKGNDYLSLSSAIRITYDYCLFMESKDLKPRVELSGGEPGLHPNLEHIISFAKACGAFVKVNTNGLALHSIPQEVRDQVDCWHVGVTGCDGDILYDIEEVNGQAQYVAVYSNLNQLHTIVDFYKNVPLKVFVDFYSNLTEKADMNYLIRYIASKHPNIKSRYTGIQENRGIICSGCKRKCITLKALWVFPNNTMSLCPQHQRKIHAINNDFMPSMEMMYNQHKVGG